MSTIVLRVHPTINFARVGTSEEFYLSPETSAGLPQDGTQTTGGLPIRAGTEREPIDSGDLRDAEGKLRRQAARFRLFAYSLDGEDSYPNGGGTEIIVGSRLADGRVVAELIWTVHLANKKANAYVVVNSEGLAAYADGKVPQLRNPEVYGTVDAPARLRQLVIDPGPRAIAASSGQSIAFDRKTPASWSNRGGEIVTSPGYPKSFPADSNDQLFEPSGPLDSLGELRVDAQGRLLVLPAFGRTAAKYDEYGDPIQLTGDLNNTGWFDDAADGPVLVTVVFEDGSTEEAHGAWVVCTDPAYAPQIRNVVSAWDDIYDVWVRELGLAPKIHDGQGFVAEFRPAFESMIRPVFRAAAMQRWTANLPQLAVQSHAVVDSITAADDPDDTIMAGLTFLRDPNVEAEVFVGVPLMPLSLGDAGKAFLSVTKTQYFFLEQWSRHRYVEGEGPALGPGEALDYASLSNCLGGRYVPGIELSYVVRQPDLYVRDWRGSGAGPFRVKHKPLDYADAKPNTPLLSGGWIPLHDMSDGLEPGDLSKFMAIPWQTDYNSCSIHQTSINTAGENRATGNPLTLYWSWPSQRPDAVYLADEVVDNVLPEQKWSVRGPGTYSTDPKTMATFQKALQSVTDWDRIGIVIQGTAIVGRELSPSYYLEVESRLGLGGTGDQPVYDWPFSANPPKRSDD